MVGSLGGPAIKTVGPVVVKHIADKRLGLAPQPGLEQHHRQARKTLVEKAAPPPMELRPKNPQKNPIRFAIKQLQLPQLQPGACKKPLAMSLPRFWRGLQIFGESQKKTTPPSPVLVGPRLQIRHA